MLIKGKIVRFAKYNPSFKSRGILIEIPEIGEKWFNITGTEEECNTIFKNFKDGDEVGIEVKDDTKIILSMNPSGAIPEKEIEGEKKVELSKSDEILYGILGLMNRCFQEAKEILKEHVAQDLLEQETLTSVALAVFKAWREDNERQRT